SNITNILEYRRLLFTIAFLIMKAPVVLVRSFVDRVEALRSHSVNGSHQSGASVLHGKTQLTSLRIHIQMQRQALQHNLLIGVCIECLVNLLGTLGNNLSAGIDGCIEEDVQALAAGSVFRRK